MRLALTALAAFVLVGVAIWILADTDNTTTVRGSYAYVFEVRAAGRSDLTYTQEELADRDYIVLGTIGP